MFKCLCGGGANAGNNDTSNNHNKHNNPNNIHSANNIHNLHPNGTELGANNPSSPISKSKSKSKSHSKPRKKPNNTSHNTNKHLLNPAINSQAGTTINTINPNNTNIKSKRMNMKTKIRSVSGATTPSPANHHINGLNKNTNIISPNIISSLPKLRKKTHPYKSRGDPHIHKSPSHTPSLSPIHTLPTNHYFIYDNFQFTIQSFDFHLHYKHLIELSLKCLNIGPDILSPSIFFKHNQIKCVVAMLHENNNKPVPISYTINTPPKKKPFLHSYHHERDHKEILLNNMIGFSICYPHSNCRPYPDSVWMIGWLACDTHRCKLITSQYHIVEALLRASHIKINPNSKTNYLPKIELNGLHKYLKLNKLTVQDIDPNQSPIPSNIPNYVKKKLRDKGIGIYAPYYHKKAQLLYESLGFEKIAKIGNYYSTDKAFLQRFYASEDMKYNEDINNAKKLHNTDAYLYCRGDLAHCRLLLGMEYFNYKKWPKKQENEIKCEENDTNDTKSSKKAKKRTHGPKILEEYLQARIADYHAKQKEQLLLRNKNKSSPAVVPKQAISHHSPQMHNIRHQQAHTHAHAHRGSHPYNNNNNIHQQHANSNQFEHNTYNQYQHRSQSAYMDKRLRFNAANTNNSAKYSPYADDAPPPNYDTPNGTAPKSDKSRHSSIANSQVNYHSGYYGHYAGHHHGGHSGHASHGAHNGPSRHRSSATPTPTYEVTHSNAVYYPHLSNVSTATYTQSVHGNGNEVGDVNMANASLGVRGSSFYSMPSSHHSNASHHSHHSNISMHSDPYLQQTGYHNQHHGHHGQRHHSINNYLPHHSSQKYMQKYDKYEEMRSNERYNAHHSHHNQHRHPQHLSDDVYNGANTNTNNHKVRNKRYRQSSRHSSHKKVHD